MKTYHVAPASHSGHLYSLLEQYDRDHDAAVADFLARWPESTGELASAHVGLIHLYATLDEARSHAGEWPGKIYEVDCDGLDVVVDGSEFDHPVVDGAITADRLQEVS